MEMEHIWAQDAQIVYDYTVKTGRRFKLGESIIAEDVRISFNYAQDVIKGRWIEAEPYIKKHPTYYRWYSMGENLK